MARQATETGVSAKEVGRQAGNLRSVKHMVKVSHLGAGWLDWDMWLVESGNPRFHRSFHHFPGIQGSWEVPWAWGTGFLIRKVWFVCRMDAGLENNRCPIIEA